MVKGRSTRGWTAHEVRAGVPLVHFSMLCARVRGKTHLGRAAGEDPKSDDRGEVRHEGAELKEEEEPRKGAPLELDGGLHDWALEHLLAVQGLRRRGHLQRRAAAATTSTTNKRARAHRARHAHEARHANQTQRRQQRLKRSEKARGEKMLSRMRGPRAPFQKKRRPKRGCSPRQDQARRTHGAGSAALTRKRGDSSGSG